MENTIETLLGELQNEGISYTRQGPGELTYTANYMRVEAEIDLDTRTITIYVNGNTFTERTYGEDEPLSLVLRDVAEAAGQLDQAVEDFYGNMEEYEDA